MKKLLLIASMLVTLPVALNADTVTTRARSGAVAPAPKPTVAPKPAPKPAVAAMKYPICNYKDVNTYFPAPDKNCKNCTKKFTKHGGGELTNFDICKDATREQINALTVKLGKPDAWY